MSHSLNEVSNGLLITFNHSLINVRCDFKVPSTFEERLTRPRTRSAAVEGSEVVQVLGNELFMCQISCSCLSMTPQAARVANSDPIQYFCWPTLLMPRRVTKFTSERFGGAWDRPGGTRSNILILSRRFFLLLLPFTADYTQPRLSFSWNSVLSPLHLKSRGSEIVCVFSSKAWQALVRRNFAINTTCWLSWLPWQRRREKKANSETSFLLLLALPWSRSPFLRKSSLIRLRSCRERGAKVAWESFISILSTQHGLPQHENSIVASSTSLRVDTPTRSLLFPPLPTHASHPNPVRPKNRLQRRIVPSSLCQPSRWAMKLRKLPARVWERKSWLSFGVVRFEAGKMCLVPTKKDKEQHTERDKSRNKHTTVSAFKKALQRARKPPRPLTFSFQIQRTFLSSFLFSFVDLFHQIASRTH